jgi:hypothetical protein
VSNNFLLPFGTADGNNAESDAAYSGSSTRLLGWQNGIVDGPTFTKMSRQGSLGSALAGQVIVDHALVDAVDDGNIPALKANWRIAVAAMLAGSAFAQDTSTTANAIVAALDPAPPTLTSFRGIYIRIANTNTGPVTIALNAIGSKTATRRDGTPFQAGDLLAGRFAHFIYDATLGQWTLSGQAAGEILRVVSNPFLYVSNLGSDTTGDGSQSKPFATTFAAATAAQNFFLTGQKLTIMHADGTYPAPGTLPASSGTILLKGNSTNPANCKFQGTGPSGTNGFLVSSPTPLQIDGFTVVNTGTNNNSVGGYGTTVTIANTVFQSTGGSYSHIVAFPGCTISIGSGVVIAGSMNAALYALTGSIQFNSFTVSGTQTFNYAFARADYGGKLQPVTGASITGGTVAAIRYAAIYQSLISSNGGGANFYPGDRSGTVDASSIYV